MVAVEGPLDAPTVIERKRIELADPQMRGSMQPFHAAAELHKAAAAKFIERCTAATNAMAKRELAIIVKDLLDRGHVVVACVNLLGSGRSPATLAAALASHPMLHTAEGEFFREALNAASRHLGLRVSGIVEKQALELGSAVFGISPDQLRRTLNELGLPLGPPWRQDEKLATLAAWLALAEGRSMTPLRSR